MEWQIERVSPVEESVFLVDTHTGIQRKISVPGTQDALMNNGKLFIKTRAGFFWEVLPDTGSRKRYSMNASTAEKRKNMQLDLLETK